MWRALHAAIFGASKQNTPVSVEAAKRGTSAATSTFATDFSAFQAAVKAAVITTPIPANGHIDGPPAPWRTRDAPHNGPHGFVAVVGESHYQDDLRKLSDFFVLIERTERTFTAKLRPEPTNPYDPNAVAVTMEDNTVIGYLAREIAATYQKRLLRQPAEVRCPAQLRGGADGESIGVVLDFEEVHV